MPYFFPISVNTTDKGASMTPIFIIGDTADCTLENLIRGCLSRTYNVTYIKGSEYSVQGCGYELVCFDCCTPVICGAENSVVIAKKDAVIPEDLPHDCTTVFCPENERQLCAVRKSGVLALDCGFSPRSTVSFSGSSENRLVITLNRTMTALSGREIQPLEFPVERYGADPYSLMCFTALRLLLDDFDSELGRLI